MNKPLKIAVFHCGFAYSGGGERLVLEEVLGLRRLGHEVVCYAPTLDRQACFPDLIAAVGVKTFLPQLPKGFPLRDALSMVMSSVLAPLMAMRFRGIDVFVGANQPGAWIAYCCAKVLRKPYVVYMNQPNRLLYARNIDQNTGWITNPDYRLLDFMVKKFRWFVAWADRLSYTRAAVMLANGAYIATIIEAIYGRRLVLCPAGCHPQPRRLLRLDSGASHDGAFKLGDRIIDKPFVLITNRHEPQKRFEYVIEAMASIKPVVPGAMLVIPGPFTTHTPRLIELARALGTEDRVLFPGRISEADLQRLYREAAVYCYPSPEEDFGMGIIEAMAWGVPVVAWKHAGPTITVVDGVSGFLAEPYKVGAYADAMTWLLKDPDLRNRMGAASRDRAERYFSWNRHVRILNRALRRASGELIEAKVSVDFPNSQLARVAPLRVVQAGPPKGIAEVETGPLVRN